MSRSDRSIIVWALVPNLGFVVALLGWAAWRVGTGQSPFPHNAPTIVIGLAVLVPMATIATANFRRLRRNA